MIAPTSDEVIMNAIRKAIQDATEAAVEECIREAQDKIAARCAEITAGVALHVMNVISMERMGQDLVIHVKMEGLK